MLTLTAHSVASAMWPWFNSNPLMSIQDDPKKLHSDHDLIGDEASEKARSKSEKNTSCGDGGGGLDDSQGDDKDNDQDNDQYQGLMPESHH